MGKLKKILTLVYLDKEDIDGIKKHAEIEGTSMSAIIRRFIKKCLRKSNNGK
jgi:hypothetical protein